MIRRRVGLAAGLSLALALAIAPREPGVRAATDRLPERLSDVEFWQLSQRLSEPDGYFRSDNLLSNELSYPHVIAELVERTPSGGVYLGVGPEQNFHYIAALRPKMAFVTDVRRGNLHTQLMYKALFELSADRVEFVSRLFSRRRPAGLHPGVTGGELIDAFLHAEEQPEAVYRQNLQAIKDQLTVTRRLPLTDADLSGIEYVYYNFYWFGPAITYNSSSGGGGRGGRTSYADLVRAIDLEGVNRSYLATEDTYGFVRDLERRNMLVPVVGNFGGPTALRAVGAYVREHGATVSAFYLSNVEQYLRQDDLWHAFCANVATMPLDGRSTFIRSGQGFGRYGGGGLQNSLGSMLDETRTRCGPGAAVPGAGR